MATSFPSQLDVFSNPSGGDAQSSAPVLHSTQHANANDAIEALQVKVGVTNSTEPTSLDYRVKSAETAIGGKVDKVAGKGLSTNDYTDAEKTKLAGVETGANAYVHPASHPASMISEDATHRFATDAEKSGWNAKLGTGAIGSTVAPLVNGLVPAVNLPSYVDDVVEAANLAAFPATGETSKIYVALDTNRTYRWSGSAYVEISASPGSTDAVTEGTSNLYFTVARVRAVVLTGLSTATNAAISAADTILSALGKLQAQITGHTGSTSNPHSVTKSQVGLGNVDNTSDLSKPISTATQTALNGKAASAHTHAAGDLSGVVKTINSVAPDASGNAVVGQLGSFRNKIINGNFAINQRGVAGTVTLAAGAYGHDRWKAGASGCVYTFATSGNVTTITIASGSVMQVIEGLNLQSGTHTLSWVGTAQGRIDSGSYGESGLTGTATGGTNQTIEFSAGTIAKVQYEPGNSPTPFDTRFDTTEVLLCQRYYWSSYPIGVSPGTAEYSPLVTSAHASVNYLTVSWLFPVRMRASPSLVARSPGDGTAGYAAVDGVNKAVVVYGTQVGGYANINNLPVYVNQYVSVHIEAIAEL